MHSTYVSIYHKCPAKGVSANFHPNTIEKKFLKISISIPFIQSINTLTSVSTTHLIKIIIHNINTNAGINIVLIVLKKDF